MKRYFNQNISIGSPRDIENFILVIKAFKEKFK